jgi:AcrR family transcriptional regulator
VSLHQLVQPSYAKGSAPLAEQSTHVESVRLRIIKATTKLITEHPIDAISVQMILEESNVSRRTFYKHFSDKSAVLVVIFERSLEHVIRLTQDRMTASDSGVGRIRVGIRAYLDFVANSVPIVRCLVAESICQDSPLAPARLAVHQKIEDQYVEAYLQAEGVVLDGLTARGLILLAESLTLHVLSPGAPDADELSSIENVLNRYVTRVIGHGDGATEAEPPPLRSV